MTERNQRNNRRSSNTEQIPSLVGNDIRFEPELSTDICYGMLLAKAYKKKKKEITETKE